MDLERCYQIWQKEEALIANLHANHFTHVTGLSVDGPEKKDKKRISAKAGDYVRSIKGSHSFKNSICSVVTPEGFCFLGTELGYLSLDIELRKKIEDENMEPLLAPNDDIKVRAMKDRDARPLSDDYGNPYFQFM